MTKANGTFASTKNTSTLVRAVFEPGMLLQHEDLDQLNAYTRDLSRLLFRSFFGCGVVCGLVVNAHKDDCGRPTLYVDPGLALNCNGDPIYVPKEQSLLIDEDCNPDIPNPLWVVLCGSVKCCGPRTSICSPDDEEPKPVCTRERDCFEIKIVKNDPKCVCRCRPKEGGDQGTTPSEGSSPASEVSLSSSSSASSTSSNDCWCADPNDDCYSDHYAGTCGCKCDDPDCTCCDCDCVLLAELTQGADGNWSVDHSVRRFIRPVLMRDPQAYNEKHPQTTQTTEATKTIADSRILDRKLQQSTERVKVLEEQLRKAADYNRELAAYREKVIRQKAEAKEKAEYERIQKQAAKSSKKKKEAEEDRDE